MDSALRYVGGAVGFGFGAMWMTVGIGAAIACLLLAALGYGVVLVAERAQANANLQRRPDEMYEVDADLPLMADELEFSDTGFDPAGFDPGWLDGMRARTRPRTRSTSRRWRRPDLWPPRPTTAGLSARPRRPWSPAGG